MPLRQRSFAVRYLTLFGGETFSKLCVIAAFAYLANVLTPTDYGTVELALAITVFFVLGVESGMGLYGARVVATHPERIPQLVPQVMVLRAILGVPAFALIVLAATYSEVPLLGILAVNGAAVLLTPFLTQWVFQGLRQMHWVAVGAAARNFTFVALVLILVQPGSDIRLVAVAEVSGICALALLNAFFLHRKLGVHLNWRGLLSGTRSLFGDVWFMGFSDFTWACLWYSPVLILGWRGGPEQVAWIGVAVRIVIALHTFVWLYFFNMLPNIAKDLAASLDDWRDLMKRSMAISMWPACLVALGGTLIAPVLIPLIWGIAYTAAVRPFQIVIWMIPVAWFSGHFRFSLIAAGHQRWEFAVSAASAAVTVIAALVLGHYRGPVGAASALLTGGVVNTALAVMASNRHIGPVQVLPSVGSPIVATAVCVLAGVVISAFIGALGATIAACLVYLVMAARQAKELVRQLEGWRLR